MCADMVLRWQRTQVICAELWESEVGVCVVGELTNGIDAVSVFVSGSRETVVVFGVLLVP